MAPFAVGGSRRFAHRAPAPRRCGLGNAHDGTDDAFNDWYTNVRLPDVVKVEGFSDAQCFRLSSAQMDDGGGEPYRYMAIYEIDADDVTVPRDALRGSVDDPGSMYVAPRARPRANSRLVLHAHHGSGHPLSARLGRAEAVEAGRAPEHDAVSRRVRQAVELAVRVLARRSAPPCGRPSTSEDR